MRNDGPLSHEAPPFAHSAEVGRLDEHVLHILDVGVHASEQAVVEHAVVYSGIILYGSFPLQVVVGRLTCYVARGEDAALLEQEVVGGGGDAVVAVIGHVKSVAGGVRDGLITGLTP